MSVWLALHVALSVAVFVLIFWIGDDEPFVTRVVTAAIAALLWLAGLILLVIFLLIDAGVGAAARLHR